MNCWYKDGLCFECTQCGKCCTGSPGFVWLRKKESIEIANFLKITLSEFSNKYLRQVGDRYALLEKSGNYDCIFLKDNKCSIYTVRPIQCKTFPFWPQNLLSEDEWKKAANICEGIRKDASLIPHSHIQSQLEPIA